MTEKLERVTDLGSKYPDEGLTPGNLNASVQAITQLAEVHQKYKNVQTTDSEINVSLVEMYKMHCHYNCV